MDYIEIYDSEQVEGYNTWIMSTNKKFSININNTISIIYMDSRHVQVQVYRLPDVCWKQ